MPRPINFTIISLMLVNLAASFIAGCTIISPSNARSGDSSAGIPIPGTADSPAQNIAEHNDVIDEAWQIIHSQYVEKDEINSANMTESAIRQMVKALQDPHTSYMKASTYQLYQTRLAGKYEGIGLATAVRDNKVIVVAILPGSPAEKAGLGVGDNVLAIDGRKIIEMSTEEAALHARGPKGTFVTLQVLRQGKTEPEEVEIVRDTIVVPSVILEMKGDIAYIRIYQFAQGTDDQLTSILKDIAAQKATGIVLDLRRNPGGILSEVVKVASHFVDNSVIFYMVDNKGKKTPVSAVKTDVSTDLPTVVLSDNFSASGSEVLIGALQDHGRATIAGAKTFGKGSVTKPFQLKDGSAIYMTVGRWLTPNDRLIEGNGIEPDITLDLKGNAAIDWAIDYLKGNANQPGR